MHSILVTHESPCAYMKHILVKCKSNRLPSIRAFRCNGPFVGCSDEKVYQSAVYVSEGSRGDYLNLVPTSGWPLWKFGVTTLLSSDYQPKS